MEGWLVAQSKKRAAAAIQRARQNSPFLHIWGQTITLFLLCLGGGYLLLNYYGSELQVLVGRMVFPQSDIPPLSPYSFTLDPAQPEVYYGEDVVLSVQVTGEAPPPQQIDLLLMTEGVPLQKLPAFRDRSGHQHWSRVLEHVTAPCAVAFATADGRARSRFVQVKINRSPRILSGSATITPLTYTGQSAWQVPLGGREIVVPDGDPLHVPLPVVPIFLAGLFFSRLLGVKRNCA